MATRVPPPAGLLPYLASVSEPPKPGAVAGPCAPPSPPAAPPVAVPKPNPPVPLPPLPHVPRIAPRAALARLAAAKPPVRPQPLRPWRSPLGVFLILLLFGALADHTLHLDVREIRTDYPLVGIWPAKLVAEFQKRVGPSTP